LDYELVLLKNLGAKDKLNINVLDIVFGVGFGSLSKNNKQYKLGLLQPYIFLVGKCRNNSFNTIYFCSKPLRGQMNLCSRKMNLHYLKINLTSRQMDPRHLLSETA
jgi:hypothetical protein